MVIPDGRERRIADDFLILGYKALNQTMRVSGVLRLGSDRVRTAFSAVRRERAKRQSDQILALSLSAESGLWHIQVAIRTSQTMKPDQENSSLKGGTSA